ncbi:MAG: ABC transporter ATP-binding protein [Acidobacteriota bacterium]|jgi:putative ABC transport system ATP-binding protein
MRIDGVDTPAPRPVLIELSEVAKVFSSDTVRERPAVSCPALTIPDRSATLVEGPSGSGKTTLLGLIGCLIRPTAGRIRIGGRDVTRLTEDRLSELRRRCFGFVFQSHHLIRGASALQNVMLPALPCPEVDGDLRPRATALLDRFALEDRATIPVERLSGGEQQRVAIARALINDPPVLLADEPTAHLDSGTARSFLGVVSDLLEGGKTVIVASHDPVLCDSGIFSRIVRIRDGRVLRCC